MLLTHKALRKALVSCPELTREVYAHNALLSRVVKAEKGWEVITYLSFHFDCAAQPGTYAGVSDHL